MDDNLYTLESERDRAWAALSEAQAAARATRDAADLADTKALNAVHVATTAESACAKYYKRHGMYQFHPPGDNDNVDHAV
jgi:hypothetical protein